VCSVVSVAVCVAGLSRCGSKGGRVGRGGVGAGGEDGARGRGEMRSGSRVIVPVWQAGPRKDWNDSREQSHCGTSVQRR
jgi:hypothetical protein